jgi:hypothetical protein
MRVTARTNECCVSVLRLARVLINIEKKKITGAKLLLRASWVSNHTLGPSSLGNSSACSFVPKIKGIGGLRGIMGFNNPPQSLPVSFVLGSNPPQSLPISFVLGSNEQGLNEFCIAKLCLS